MGAVIRIWRRSRLERLKEAVLALAADVRKNPLQADAPHSGYTGMGRLIYETATREYKACEIPKALRACPWVFVIAELAREFPDVRWHEGSLVEYVRQHIETLQSHPGEVLLFKQKGA